MKNYMLFFGEALIVISIGLPITDIYEATTHQSASGVMALIILGLIIKGLAKMLAK